MCNFLTSIVIKDLDVYQALLPLDPSKAVGYDSISPRILHYCALGLYVPLHHLFCLSLSNCIMPSDLFVHVITPILKSGDWFSVRNYKPISLLCSVSKVLERIAYDKIIDLVSPSLSHQQFGFLTKWSVVQQLLMSLSRILSSFSCHSQTDVLYTCTSTIRRYLIVFLTMTFYSNPGTVAIVVNSGYGSSPTYLLSPSVSLYVVKSQTFSQSSQACHKGVY